MKNKKLLITLLSGAYFFLNGQYALAQESQYNLQVDGITCPFCVATSSKALLKIDGIKKVDADLEKGIIKVCADQDTQLDDQMLTTLFLEKGFNYKGKEVLEACDFS